MARVGLFNVKREGVFSRYLHCKDRRDLLISAVKVTQSGGSSKVEGFESSDV